ncbi:MAG TPA: helix-turn-helix transcriptional regulator [Amycolatopsis sp.]|nr:helix-turn-helix transcriptional regulator [Amycolatopsis sp.]
MTDELAGLSTGERIQTIRTRTGKSRAVVAGLLGHSADWLKKIEKGERKPPQVDKLIQIAEILGCRDLSELTGGAALPMGIGHRNGHPVVEDLRDAIESAFLVLPDGPEPVAAQLIERTDELWRRWHDSPTPRAETGSALAQLIREGRRAVRVLDGPDRRDAYAALSGAYALSEQVLAWVADGALLRLAADRCMDAAEQADQPIALTAAAWVLGNVWRSTGREEEAVKLADDGASLLSSRLDSGTDAERALWGASRLHASISLAKIGREGDALRRLDDATRMAGKLPAGYTHPWTLYGVANSAFTAVSVQVELRRAGSALDHMAHLDPDDVPSLDRRARLWLETARAYRQRGDWMSTLHVLERAASVSTESMQSHPLARGLAGELVTSGGRLVQKDARALAARLGVTV